MKPTERYVLTWQFVSDKLPTSIGTKIILPYLLLTLAVASVGAFVVTTLVTSSLRERFNNQLLDAGRVVSESVVIDEQERLNVLRQIAYTEGVAQGVSEGDLAALARLISPIIGNTHLDALAVIDGRGQLLYGWQRTDGQTTFDGRDFAQIEDVQLVLNEYADQFGNKRIFLADTVPGPTIFTAGPVFFEEEVVGAVMVGTVAPALATYLSQRAIARVTLYDREGQVVATTLGDNVSGGNELLQEPQEQYNVVVTLLNQSSNYHRVVTMFADSQVPLRQVEILNQNYQLAYGDWRLRSQSFGLFSVALPSNFIVNAAATSRNRLSLLFSIATVVVLTMGFLISQRIVGPLNRLVDVTTVVAGGNLDQRTNIQRRDEIGALASSFDIMTENLAERNRQLIAKASELEAIVHSIADGVIVFDADGRIITSNPAAEPVLSSILPHSGVLQTDGLSAATHVAYPLVGIDGFPGSQRYSAGNKVFSTIASPVKTPAGDKLGQVLVLRDVTREAEAEQLKDNFITSISHELRTPLTAIKGYLGLLSLPDQNGLDERQMQFLKIVNDKADELIEHVNKLIEIMEIQNQTLKLEQKQQNLVGLAAGVVEAWQERFDDKKLRLSLVHEVEALWVNGDARRLMWAIENLVANAYHYTPEGGMVEVCILAEANQARLAVADTGIGISDIDQSYLFSRFFRAQQDDSFNVGGLGLGLFITKSIVELHGGHVSIQSQLGSGSTFSLTLPLIA